MPLSVLALCLLAGAIAYAYAWHYGYKEGRIDGRLEAMAMQEEDEFEGSEGEGKLSGGSFDPSEDSPYDLDDPKHETYHERYAELADRERKEEA